MTIISTIVFKNYCLILAEWVEIGGKNYDFNPAGMSHSEASAMCKSMGGKLFEPKDEKTNREAIETEITGVVVKKALGQNRHAGS